MHLHYICTNNKYDLHVDNYLCKEMFLFSSTQHFLFPPRLLILAFYLKILCLQYFDSGSTIPADLQNSGSLSSMSWHTLLKMSIFLLGVVSNCCWKWSSPNSSINKTVSSWVYESPLAAIVLLIINILNNASEFFVPSMRIWSFTLFNSIAIDLVHLHWTLDRSS